MSTFTFNADQMRKRAAAPADPLAVAAGLDSQGRHDDAVEQLRRAAKLGHPAAATHLAKRLLVGRNAPNAPQEGVVLLQAAAGQGEAEAFDVLATLTGAGAWVAQSWPAALALLVQAAEKGRHHARAQLALLAHDPDAAAQIANGTALDADIWKRLAARVDVDAWVTPPSAPKQVHGSPRIWAVENFASPQLCNWLIERARGKLKPAMMYHGPSKAPKILATRTNSDFMFDIVESDLVVLLTRMRVSAITELPLFAFEPPQIFHYSLGQEIKAHYDTVRIDNTGYGGGDYKGDRIRTFLLYLNHDYEGGALEFPKVDFRHRGKTGDAVFFANVEPDGKPDRLSLHAALPILKNEKWILSQWIHDRAFTHGS